MKTFDIFIAEYNRIKEERRKELYRQKREIKFKERAIARFGGKFNYDKVYYVSMTKKVCIICPKHGEFWQTPVSHLSNVYACPRCLKELKAIPPNKKTTREFVEEAIEIHGDKYDYSKVDYIDAKTLVCIVCPEHGEFWQAPDKHINAKHICPKCNGRNRTTEDWIKECIAVHGDEYDYSKVEYKTAKDKVLLYHKKCKRWFWQDADSHLNSKAGCPWCCVADSSYENYLEKRLLMLFDAFDKQYDGDDRYPFKCDFYIKSQDLFIEVNGYWTHGGHWFDENNPKDIEQLSEWKNKNSIFYKSAIHTWTVRDVKKREYARKNNLNYVVFWGASAIDQIDEWISEGCPIRKDWQ